MPDHTADELQRLAASVGVPVSAVIREALRRALPAIHREIKRNTPGGGCYVGRREPTGAMVTRPDGSPLPLEPSLAVCRLSPSGFEWGFQGSGPAQLALALLLDHTGDPDLARSAYQQFYFVARWRDQSWTLHPRDINSWLAVGVIDDS